jgi:hypothetical protein
MTLSTEEKEEIEAMHREAYQSFKDAVAKVHAELEQTGMEFPYLLDGKVVHITMEQLKALKQQAAITQENTVSLETR